MCPTQDGSESEKHSWCQSSRPRPTKCSEEWDNRYSHVALGGQVHLASHPPHSGHPALGGPDHPEENRVAGSLEDRDASESQLYLRELVTASHLVSCRASNTWVSLEGTRSDKRWWQDGDAE